MKKFKENIPDGFDNPVAIPKNSKYAKNWQKANCRWWEEHPMRYDWKEKINFPEFSREFYLEIDKRFFSEAGEFMPWRKIPFDSLIDFKNLKNKDVLEIGTGNGSHAQLLAQFAHSFTGIDLTNYAVKSTSKRLKIFDLNGTIEQMDAENMKFRDNTFDFIWSWGVIHHSSDPRNILREMHRVLKLGGLAITMVYHRNFWNYYLIGGLYRGVIQGNLMKEESLHNAIQKGTDGALARYYSISEWRTLASEFFNIENIQIFGSKSEVIPFPQGKAKNFLRKNVPNKLTRFLTNTCGMGTFLVSTLKKKS